LVKSQQDLKHIHKWVQLHADFIKGQQFHMKQLEQTNQRLPTRIDNFNGVTPLLQWNNYIIIWLVTFNISNNDRFQSARSTDLKDYVISTDKSLLDLYLVHNFLSNSSYWAQGRSYEVVKRSIEHSICFGVYLDDQQNQKLSQVGFGRIVTDYATFAWLCDVFIIEPHRGRGLGKWLLECIISYPDLTGLKRFVIATRDAHGLYKQFGFENVQFWLVDGS